MRKSFILITAGIVLSASLAGCSEKSTTTPGTERKTASVSEFTESEPTEGAADEAASSFLAGEESSKNPTSSNVADTISTPSKAKSLSPPQTVSETPTPKPEAVPPPETTKPSAPPVSTSPEPTPPPQPTPPIEAEGSAPTEPPKPSFDVSTYIAYAKSYGQSIGLTLDSTAVSCWDNPIGANGKSAYLERDLRDLLDWYKASGYTAFWVWSEDLGSGNYSIYVGYA